jgi:uncharacterized protein (TIGR02266 family)
MEKTILLVDDLQMFIEIEKDFLRDTRMDILTARDGIEALDVVKSKQPDLIFMDLEMPRMDGWACCRAIRSDPAVANVPVVMVTSSGNEEKCRLAGCDHFLTKPLDRDIFLDVARKYLPDIDRREKRVGIKTDCLVRVRDETIMCHLHDLSKGGTFVATDELRESGTVVQITFTLPDGTVIACSGRIAWLNRNESKLPKGFGVKFSLLTKDAKSALKNFLEPANSL